jgi:hypothetical protein
MPRQLVHDAAADELVEGYAVEFDHGEIEKKMNRQGAKDAKDRKVV